MGLESWLLCDFTVYLNHFYNELDFEKLHAWCRESRIFHLYEIILACCRNYLGLAEQIDPEVTYDTDACEHFLSMILEGGDMGTNTNHADCRIHLLSKNKLVDVF